MAMAKVKRGQGSRKHGKHLRLDVRLQPHPCSRKLDDT
jgi:hypothetical protein